MESDERVNGAGGNRTDRILLGLLFTATGGAALIAEQVFERLLSTLVGTSSPAAAITLSVYFAGLTLGGIAYFRLLAGRSAPLAIYARAELVVGIVAVILAAGFERLIAIFVPLLQLGADAPLLLLGLRMVVAAFWILPPTIAMGLSFPAIVDTLASMERGSARGRHISWFYALNLLGAIVGAAGGVLLFSAVGLDGALLLIAAIELTVYLVASRLSRRLRGEEGAVADASAASVPAIDAAHRRVLVAIAFASGFLFFALEIVWTHLITVVCGNSVYAFATMLTSVLAGLFAGGVLSSRLFGREDRVGVVTLSGILLIGAGALLLTQQLWPGVPHVFTVLGGNIHSFWLGELLRGGVAFVLLFPSATVLGSVFPLLFRLRDFPAAGQGAMAGRMTAANALGSIAGALVSGFVLIPLAGSELTLRMMIAAYAIAAAAAALLVPGRAARRWVSVGAVAGCAVAALLPRWDRLALTSGEHVYFHPAFVRPGSRLLFFKEDFAGGVTTVVRTGRSKVLLTNGKFQGNDAGERIAQIGLAVAPALHLTRFDDALVVGLGSGQSAHTVQRLGFRRIRIAEISPAIVEAARREFRAINGGVVDDPHVTLTIEDGRNLLLLDDTRYDLITMEISSIWFAGSTSLYSREYYELARRRLKPGGVFQQWIQLHHISTDDFTSALLTVRAVFPTVSFWIVGTQGIIVATEGPQVLRLRGVEAAERAVSDAGVAREVGLRALLHSRVLAPAHIDLLRDRFSALPLNTDRNRRLEYRTPRQNLSRIDWLNVNTRFLIDVSKSSAAPYLAEPALSRWLQSKTAQH